MSSTEDPILRLAQQRIVAASADIEAQLSILDGCRPVLIVLLHARAQAAEALAELAILPADASIELIRRLQHEMRRYDDIVGWFRKIVSDGFDYSQKITAEDREEMIDLLTRTPEGQREAMELGLIARDNDA